ncbi:MAG: hypothetical protein WC644_01145 [Ignavibacteria bacterium]
MTGQKYWITPKGDLIDISSINIEDHYKYINDTEEGKKLMRLFNVFYPYGGINKDNLYFLLIKGFIMAEKINTTLYVTYGVRTSADNVPVSKKTANTLLEYLLKDTIKEVYFKCCVLDKGITKTLPKMEYAQIFTNLES